MVISRHARNTASRCALACALATAMLGASPAFASTPMPPAEFSSQEGMALSASPAPSTVSAPVESADIAPTPSAEEQTPILLSTQPEAPSGPDATPGGQTAPSSEAPAGDEDKEGEAPVVGDIASPIPEGTTPKPSPAPEGKPTAPDASTENRPVDGEAAPETPSTPAKPVTIISPEPSKIVLKEESDGTAPKPQPAPESDSPTQAPVLPPPLAPAGKFVEMEPTAEANNDVVQRSKISCSESANAGSAECGLARRLPADKPVENMFVLKWDADEDSSSTTESLEMTVPLGEKLNNFQLLLAPPSLASGAQATDSLTLELRDENGKTETVLLNTPQLREEAAAGRMEPLAYPVRPSEVAPSLGPIRSITFLPGAKSETDPSSGELSVETDIFHDPFGSTPQVGTVLAGLVALPDFEEDGDAPRPSAGPESAGTQKGGDVQAGGVAPSAASPTAGARVQRPTTPQDFAPRPQLAAPTRDGSLVPRAEILGGEPAPVNVPEYEQDPTLNAVNFTPAALEPSLVALLQAAGISLALIGSFSLITAEERRRRG